VDQFTNAQNSMYVPGFPRRSSSSKAGA